MQHVPASLLYLKDDKNVTNEFYCQCPIARHRALLKSTFMKPNSCKLEQGSSVKLLVGRWHSAPIFLT